ncbi:FecR domain-containing protein [Sphingobacterium sp. lm-10]|uniref:FecR family protein n=1 Tax=Sphingobacterium sp. lm-10 TaxID=2944904 RepID=UPI002021056B|nr:FecR domain-containing protein [Sphingobacterium sp. lm-10]
MELRKLKELLDKHQSGQASEAERQLIETWYASFSKNEEQDPLVNSIQKAHIRSQIWSGIQIGPPLPKRTFKQRYLLPMISAAAVLLVLGITINQDILTFRSSIQQATLPKFQSSTGTKERKMLVLPDSTQVWLNANSTIQVLANYGDSNRIVRLSGEAFFDVAHQPSKPFIVELDDLKVKVLGTAFNINGYAGLQTINVSVDRGAVMVEKNGVPLEKLSHGQSLVFVKEKGTYALYEDSNKGSWREGKVVLAQASFEEMAQVIKNMHGVVVKKPVNTNQAYSYDLTLYANRPLSENMEKICSIHRLKYRRVGDELILY